MVDGSGGLGDFETVVVSLLVVVMDMVVMVEPIPDTGLVNPFVSREARFGLPNSISVGSGGKVPSAKEGSSGSSSRNRRESSKDVRTAVVTDLVGNFAFSGFRSFCSVGDEGKLSNVLKIDHDQPKENCLPGHSSSRSPK